MPFPIATLADLRAQNRANFAARLTGADTMLRRSVIAVLADICAYPLYAAYRALVWVSKQLFIDSAEAPYLDRRGAEYGLAREQATAAVLTADFTFTQAATIPAGTLVQSSDFSQTYALTAAVTSAGAGVVAGNVTAQTVGSAANQANGAILTLMTAISGVQAPATVAATVTTGTDAETDSSLRARILARIQNPPQGGAGADFWQWARNSGVPTRAWVYPLNSGIGTCDVTFVIDSRANKIPLSADISAVQAAIDAARPVIGESTVFAPVADALAITIHGLNPNTSAMQAAIVAQLDALIASVPPGGAGYGDGVTEPLTTGALFPTQVPGTLYLSQINAAIEAAGGVIDYDLTAPAADVVFATGHIPAIPTVTFT